MATTVTTGRRARGSTRARVLAPGGTSGRRNRPLQIGTVNCESLTNLQPQALGLTYWFDPPEDGQPFDITIRFVGHRIGVRGRPGRRDSFEVVERLHEVLPGSGPVAITTAVSDVAPGEWHVKATAQELRADPHQRRSPVRLPSASSSGVTGYAPIIRIRAPGARLGAWPALVSLGALVALGLQWVLSRRGDLPAARVLLVSLAASILGLATAKLYYAVEHRGQGKAVVAAGLCIQGFVLGAIGALVVGSVVLEVPVGPVLDVTAPGLLFAMAIGRLGCFFGGCCAGRPTRSRWGLWSSDRHLGVRRIPTQLLESALAATIGLAALAAVTTTRGSKAGAVFVAALAAYTFGRQLLFPLRSLARSTRHGRAVTMVGSAAVLAASVVALLGS